MKAEELDKIFDEGKEDILPYLDLARAVRPGHAAKRVNVDFPEWMLSRLDLEADRLGIPRQSLIKIWIGERLAARRRSKSVRPKRRAKTLRGAAHAERWSKHTSPGRAGSEIRFISFSSRSSLAEGRLLRSSIQSAHKWQTTTIPLARPQVAYLLRRTFHTRPDATNVA